MIKKLILWALLVFSVFSYGQSNSVTYQTLLARSDLTWEEKAEKLLQALTLQEKISLVHASGKFHINSVPRLGIPEMWLSDGPHGVRHQIERHSWKSAEWTNDYATYLPHLTSVAASWDKNMATLHGYVLGREARDRNKDFILGPGVNLARLPLYGRNFEYMGEDPVLAAKLVVPEIQAIQAQDVAATVKHYALNTQELNREGVNAKPDERTLREVYLPAFEAAVKEGGVFSMMGAYNQYYGTNANQSAYLVNKILKGEWGFSGVLLTDWNVDINTYDAAMNGLDLEMGTKVERYQDYFFADPLFKLIKQGEVPESILNDKVKRILGVQFRIGMQSSQRKLGARNTLEHQENAKKIAENGVVLLKNTLVNQQPLLPINTEKTRKILVMGPNANKKHGSGGGSSEVKSLYEITPLMGLKKALADHKVDLTYLRAKPDVLSPIPSEYILSRHWTGTPAWETTFYQNAKHTQVLKNSWLTDSVFQPPKKPISAPSTMNFITMKAQLQPLVSGNHLFKLKAQGQVSLKVNNRIILSSDTQKEEIFEKELWLDPKEIYDIEIQYHGKHELLLGWETPGDLFATREKYLALASEADLVIYFGGLSHADDRESVDRANMKLPNQQDEIINQLLNVNNKTIVFLIAGSAVEMPWVEEANSIVWGWYGGMEAGNAFADILLGKTNPSGKLPITLPKFLQDTAPIALDDYNEVESFYREGVFIGYRWFEQQKIRTLFPFGHGLSYTDFTLSNLTFSQPYYDKATKSLEVSVKVTNTGKVYGGEVVQLYLHDKKSTVERPYKELKSFEKVFLKPGESQRVYLTLNKRDLSFWDVINHQWLAEPGEFDVLIGTSSQDIQLKKTFRYLPQ